ncbi:hypothetical protein pb186bvf_002940 [Paramecium bursaria]
MFNLWNQKGQAILFRQNPQFSNSIIITIQFILLEKNSKFILIDLKLYIVSDIIIIINYRKYQYIFNLKNPNYNFFFQFYAIHSTTFIDITLPISADKNQFLRIFMYILFNYKQNINMRMIQLIK